MASSAATMIGAERAVERMSPLPLWAQREADRLLSDAGLLARERGRATKLRRLAYEHTPGTLEGLFHQVEAQGATQTSVVRVCQETRDAAIAKRLKLPARALLVEIERLRLADGEPLALDR